MAEGDSNTQASDRPLLQQSLQPTMPVPGQKKKYSSFQITSVTVSNRLSNDGGEDSADETEDVSEVGDGTRVNDEDDESKAPPIIPTSTEYGICIDSNSNSGDLPDGVTVNMTESGLALGTLTVPVLVPPVEEGKFIDELDLWQSRFKVVKIETVEPIRRGRWVCTDYMDQPALVDLVNQKEEGSGNSSNASSVNNVPSDNAVTSDLSVVHQKQEHTQAIADSVSSAANVAVKNNVAQSHHTQTQNQYFPPCTTSSAKQSQIPECISVGAQTVVTTCENVPQVQAIPAALSASLATLANYSSSQPHISLFPQVTEVTSSQSVRSPKQPAVSITTNTTSSSDFKKRSFLPPGIIDQPTPLLDKLEEVTNGTGLMQAEGGSDESASSGGSTVAIDNKIEQAMDLVKSHLMFAVREEVEVLKEKISELVEKIQHLENENNILKTNASQETLAQLPQMVQNQPPPSSPPITDLQTPQQQQLAQQQSPQQQAQPSL